MSLKIDQDHSRFRNIVRGKIRQNLRRYISQGEMLGRKGKDLVSIPIPQIVEASAKALGNVEHLTVLNGAQGLSEIMSQLVSQGGAVYKVARELVAPEEPSPNGKIRDNKIYYNDSTGSGGGSSGS